MPEKFSVCQFLEDGSYEYVRRDILVEEALEVAKSYCNNVSAKLGLTKRVIITDSGDCTVFEWKSGEGVVFPPPI